MTTRDEGLPSGAQQADALDAFLNDLADGHSMVDARVDPELGRTAHRLQQLADATLNAHLDDGSEARTWEALMRSRSAKPQLVTRSSVLPLTLSQKVILIPPSRLRRFGSQSLGLVATLTLVALIGLSGLAVYLTAPQRDDPATAAVVAGASPTTTITTADSQEILYGPCDVAPRDYNALMAMISDRILVPEPTVPPSVASESGTVGRAGPTYSLPEGGAVSLDIRTELVGVLGSWTNCDLFLRTALSTDDYLVRTALEGPIAGPIAFLWWLHSHPDAVHPAPTVVGAGRSPVPASADAEPAPSGMSTDAWAYGFRMLDEDHIAAYLASPFLGPGGPGSVSVPVGPPRYEESGYVVLARQPDGRWLVDEWHFSRRGADTTCSGACATPVGS